MYFPLNETCFNTELSWYINTFPSLQHVKQHQNSSNQKFHIPMCLRSAATKENPNQPSRWDTNAWKINAKKIISNTDKPKDT